MMFGFSKSEFQLSYEQMVPILLYLLVILSLAGCSRYPAIRSEMSAIAPGWSKTMVNATIFRSNSIVTHNNIQYVAYYDSSAHVVLSKRTLGSDRWIIKRTAYTGNASDAHNGISIMMDGDGYLHMAWDHHGDTLHYCRSVTPETLEMGKEESMVGRTESNVSYPEFYRLPSGDLIFIYRDGSSGNGNMIINRYNKTSKQWSRVQDNLVSGEGTRNAYWQCYISKAGVMHLSWVWREHFNVETNHDMCYAVSYDEGKTWKSSTGGLYTLPITINNAEYAARIPQGSNLINQTSMVADENETPFIATYYKMKADSATQYNVIYKTNGEWRTVRATARKTDFTLGGAGTRSIPISRPKILFYKKHQRAYLLILYRDEEYANNVCIGIADVRKLKWKHSVITGSPVERWEPTYDTELWKNGLLHLFVQKVGQESGERSVAMKPQMVGVMEVSFD